MANNLVLENIGSIRWEREVFTSQSLESDASRPHECESGIGLQYFDTPLEFMFRMLAIRFMPVTIKADSEITLIAQFECFPEYNDEGEIVSQSYAIRLVPREGRIVWVSLQKDRTVPVDELAATPDRVTCQIGEGILRLEVLYAPISSKDLADLLPPQYEPDVN